MSRVSGSQIQELKGKVFIVIETALQTTIGQDTLPAIRVAARTWEEATTDRSLERRDGLVNDRSKVVTSFFTFSQKVPSEVKAADVKAWQANMEEPGITASTIYIRTSMLSSFYRWAMANTPLGNHLNVNPVALARTKKPKP